MKRVFLIILDSFGIGASPDAKKYGDENANTLKSLRTSSELDIPNLRALGLFSIDGCGDGGATPVLGAYGRLCELSAGKDTTTGHWEIAGLITERPMPTYPEGFPKEVIAAFEKACGVSVLCNKPYSGTQVIKDFGEEHQRTGALIVYTSADSVFQIAAHEDTVPCSRLYEYCRRAREILTGEHSVGRVIARPFAGSPGSFYRTENRRDFSLKPHGQTVLDKIKDSGLSVIGVGKIGDIFAGCGLTESYPTHGNAEGMKVTAELAERDFRGLCFVNLVDFDSKYGHRQDISGYAAALSEFDGWLGDFMKKLSSDDVLMISADHGCDPGDDSTDHTREYIPLLVYGDGIESKNLGTASGFYHVGAAAASLLGVEHGLATEKGFCI